jgi:hypothetical protein
MQQKKLAWVISVDMGYGHQRAAYPFKDIAYQGIITANSSKILTKKEKKTWRRMQAFYEGISRFKSFPIIGKHLWNLYDKLQAISPIYPFRDLSKPSFESLYIHSLIKKGFLKSITEYTEQKKLPFLTTFFETAIAADYHKRENVYCIITDTDLHRVWVSNDPKLSNIVYFTPTHRATKRLQQYGVPKKNIVFTGFPLPKENTGENMEILKVDLGARLINLDPNKKFISRSKKVIKADLKKNLIEKSTHPLTITFAIGGAGAQTEIVLVMIESLKQKILDHKIRINLIAGTRPKTSQIFIDKITELGLTKEVGSFINILCNVDRKKYFESFNDILHSTDILWSKPSEICFYSGLGLPIIIAPPIGYHELRNQDWLIKMGSGINQEDPRYINEWLFEWIDRGVLAQAAWEGYTEAPQKGTYNIEKILQKKVNS